MISPAHVPKAGCCYRVDPHDQVVSVDEGWVEFAEQNDGFDLLPEKVMGTSLWGYIVGLETRLLYKLILDRIRHTQVGIAFPLRCDGPTCRRSLDMRIKPDPDGSCTFTTRILHEMRRPYQPLLDVRHPRNNDSLPMCSWCMNIESEPSRWEMAERGIRRLALRLDDPLPQVIHTVCPDCADRIEKICMAA